MNLERVKNMFWLLTTEVYQNSSSLNRQEIPNQGSI